MPARLLAAFLLFAAFPLTLNADDCAPVDWGEQCGGFNNHRCSCSDALPLWTRADEPCDPQKWPISRDNIAFTAIEIEQGTCSLKKVRLEVSYKLARQCPYMQAVPYSPDSKHVRVSLIRISKDNTFPKNAGRDDLGAAPQPKEWAPAAVEKSWQMEPKTKFPADKMTFENPEGSGVSLKGNYRWALEADLLQGGQTTGRRRQELLVTCGND